MTRLHEIYCPSAFSSFCYSTITLFTLHSDVNGQSKHLLKNSSFNEWWLFCVLRHCLHVPLLNRPSSCHQLFTRTQLPQFCPFRAYLFTPVQSIRTHCLPSCPRNASLPRSNPPHPSPTRSLQSVSFTAYLCTISALTTHRSHSGGIFITSPTLRRVMCISFSYPVISHCEAWMRKAVPSWAVVWFSYDATVDNGKLVGNITC